MATAWALLFLTPFAFLLAGIIATAIADPSSYKGRRP